MKKLKMSSPRGFLGGEVPLLQFPFVSIHVRFREEQGWNALLRNHWKDAKAIRKKRNVKFI